MVVIKTFSTPGGMYVYDRGTNALLSVSADEYIACRKVETGTATDEDWQLLKRYTDQGYLKESRLKEIIHPATEYMPFQLESGVNQLTLQICTTCNLRCSYCTYSGNYVGQRTHGDRVMSFDMIKKCVDFIMQRSRNVDRITLGFYGGESLLEVDNIKACIDYVKKAYCGRDIHYTITTNGTCLDDDIIQFLEKNNINLVVSIDGPKKLHDLHRVYANGEGSFDDIMRNVSYIKSHYPEYYEKVSFMTVVAPGVDFSCVSDFFYADDVLADNSSQYNTINTYGAKENIIYDDLYTITYTYQVTKHLLAALGMYSKNKASKLFASSITLAERLYSRLSKGLLAEKTHPSGPCLPGIMRPFVDVDGRIFPCERVSEGSEAMQIGHVNTGFDIEKAVDMLNVGWLTKQECMACWNFSYCGLCVAACDGGDGQLRKEERLKHCHAAMVATLDTMMAVCLLSENGYEFTNI